MNLLPSTTDNEYVANELFIRGGQRLALGISRIAWRFRLSLRTRRLLRGRMG